MKKRVAITIDPSVWELAKHKINEPLSSFIQKQLEIACRLTDNKSTIEKELYETEKKRIALQSQLCKLKKDEELMSKSKHNFELCMEPVNRIHNVAGVVGENQLNNIAMHHNVNTDDLIEYCVSQKYNVVPLFEFNHDTMRSNRRF